MVKQIYQEGYRQLVKHLRKTRLSLGMTQADVAEKLGICRTWIAKVEQCEQSLDLVHLVNLCKVYGLKAEDLLDMLEHGL